MEKALYPIHRQASNGLWKMKQALFFIFPISYTYQNPLLKDYEDLSSGVKPYHFISLLLFIISFGSVPHRAFKISLLFAVPFLLSSAVNNSFGPRFFSCIGFLMVLCAAASANKIDLMWSRRGALFSAISITVVALYHLPQIYDSMSSNVEGRSLYPTLLAGGVNIEATTLIIMIIWSSGRRVIWPLISIPPIFFLMQTRTVLFSIPAIFKIIAEIREKRIKYSYAPAVIFLTLAILISIILIMTLFPISQYIDYQKVLDRLQDMGGQDNGSKGRLLLYNIAMQSAGCLYLGCGAGAAADIIHTYGYAAMIEDNFHNVFVQQAIEFGVMGSLAYVYIFFIAIRDSSKITDNAGIYGSLLATFLMSLFQFNGLEFLTAFLLGLGISCGNVQASNSYMRK